jgi:hypothetical protein
MSPHNPQTSRTSSKKKGGRKSNATKLAHRKFRFIEQVIADSRLSPLATRVAIFVGSRCSLDHGGQAIIGQDKIAEKLNAWRQDVSQALRQVVAFGHIEIIRRGRDHANAYRMVLRDELPAADDVTDSVTSSPPHDVGKNPTSSMSENPDIKPDMMSANPDFDVGKNPTESPFVSPGLPSEAPGRQEREPNADAFDTYPGGGSPPLDAGPPRQDGSPTAAPSARPESPTEKPQPLAQEESGGAKFSDLRAIWARPWADDDSADRRAFELACQEVAPDDIIAAAQAWVAAADNPRFLPSLAKWLANRGWEKPPPKRGRARGNGKAQHPYGKPDMFKICLEAGGYREDADGNMYWPGDDPNSGAGEDDDPITTSMWGGGR